MSVMLYSQKRILGWHAYLLVRLDQKVLSRLIEYDGVITRSPFSVLSRVPPNTGLGDGPDKVS